MSSSIPPEAKIGTTRAHVYFWALPVGAEFEHKGSRFEKTGEEEAKFLPSGQTQVFEIHWGCIIAIDQAKEYDLEEKSFRSLD